MKMHLSLKAGCTVWMHKEKAMKHEDLLYSDFREMEERTMGEMVGLVDEYYRRCDAFDKTIESVRDVRPPRHDDLSRMQANARSVAQELGARAGMTLTEFKRFISWANRTGRV